MAKAKKTRVEDEEFVPVSTGVVLAQVRELDRTHPERFKTLSDEEYVAKLAFEERRTAILDDARARGIGFGLSDCFASDLDALARRFGCADPWLCGEIPGKTLEIPVRNSPLTERAHSEGCVFRNFSRMTADQRAAAIADDVRRAALLADADARRIPLGLTEAMTTDLDWLEEIVRTRAASKYLEEL